MQVTQEMLDMAILAAPVAVIVLTGLGLLLLLLRCYKTGGVLALLALVLNVMTEQIPIHLGKEVPATKPAGTIRVMEYNICGKLEFEPRHHEEFVEYVLAQDADILFLPENTPGTAPMLEEALREAYPYSLYDFEDFSALNHYPKEQSIYSRYPLSNYKNYEIDREKVYRDRPDQDSIIVHQLGYYFPAYEVTADVNGTPVTLLHFHLRSNSYDRAKFEGNRRREKVHNIFDRMEIGYFYRSVEAGIIADSLQNCPNPLIVCGDFNDFSGSRVMRMIQQCRTNNIHKEHRDRLNDAWWKGGLGLGFTFADQHLRLRLDHILYSKEFKLTGVKVEKVSYSDHRPIVADFEMN